MSSDGPHRLRMSVTPVQQPATVKELAMTVISTTTAAAGAR
jgi:hypothetical protein